MNIKITPATEKDFEEIANIYIEEFSKPPYNEPWTLKKGVKKLKTYSKYCDIWKVTEDGRVLGFTVINTNWLCPGEIVFGEELAIKSQFQNKGIGTQVLNFIFKEYKNKGYKTLMGIENKNAKARSLYNKLGIIESKENILIEKELN